MPAAAHQPDQARQCGTRTREWTPAPSKQRERHQHRPALEPGVELWCRLAAQTGRNWTAPRAAQLDTTVLLRRT